MQNVHYTLNERIATIRLDDGKRNALSPELIAQIYEAFDRAEADGAAVIITGRESVFSAGFDLNVMRKGGTRALGMLRAGYGLTARVLSFPYPVVAACNGHSLAMGVFLMLSADYVIGTRGDFKIAANEVAIGMLMPRVAVAMCRHRLTPAAFQRAVVLAEYFDVESAREAGFFDEVVETAELEHRANKLALQFLELDAPAHTGSKRRIRKATVRTIRRGIPLDILDAALVGLRRARKS